MLNYIVFGERHDFNCNDLCLFLRSLPPLAKKYVLQLLYIDVPVTASSLQEWVLAEGASKHRVAVDRLIQLRVFTETVDRYICLLIFPSILLKT